MRKTFIGPRLRQLRRDSGQTQAQMADRLGISPAYVNLLEKNQRSLSVQVLMALSDEYNVDWRDVVLEKNTTVLSDLRNMLQDPLFSANPPDLDELRAAIDHAPRLIDNFIKLYQSHRTSMEKIMQLGSERMPREILDTSPETMIHDFFRDNLNHFDALERAAESLAAEENYDADDAYAMLKNRLKNKHNITINIVPVESMNGALRVFDAETGNIQLSEALDHKNRTFQLAHILCFEEFSDILNSITDSSNFGTETNVARCQIELANYFAAAFLMPYEKFITLAEKSRYDIDRLASGFLVSFEQVCHRLTTLQRHGRRGVPFFFLRVDKAGNVTKRFNATTFNIAEHGGSCPVWNIHTAFRMPGVILPQFVELPDGEQFFTLSCTTERPVYSHDTQDRRLSISLGCEIKHADKLIYTSGLANSAERSFSQIGINCHLCLRKACSQRAHAPLFTELTTDTSRRGETRYES